MSGPSFNFDGLPSSGGPAPGEGEGTWSREAGSGGQAQPRRPGGGTQHGPGGQPQQCGPGEGGSENWSWGRQGCQASHSNVGLEATRTVGLGPAKRAVGASLNLSSVGLALRVGPGRAKRAVGASLSNVGPETTPRAGFGTNRSVGASLRTVRIGPRVDPGAGHKMDQVMGASNVTRVIIITIRVLVSKMFVKALGMDTVDAARCWSKQNNII